MVAVAATAVVAIVIAVLGFHRLVEKAGRCCLLRMDRLRMPAAVGAAAVDGSCSIAQKYPSNPHFEQSALVVELGRIRVLAVGIVWGVDFATVKMHSFAQILATVDTAGSAVAERAVRSD